MEENKDVNPEVSSPSEDVKVEPSTTPETPEQTQDTEQATPQQAEVQEQEKPQTEESVPYDRFKEKVDEVNWYKQQMEQMAQKPPQQPSTPTADPYANMAAEEKVFYQNLDKRTQELITKEVNKREATFRQIIGGLMTRQFRKDFPDIKPNSQEDMEIARKVSMGYQPEDAYWAVMGPKKAGEKQVATQQQQQQRNVDKQKANVVSSQSNSPQSVPAKKETFEEELRRRMGSEWNGEL